MAMTLLFSGFLAGSAFFSAGSVFFLAGWGSLPLSCAPAVANHGDASARISKMAREICEYDLSVFIDSPPFDEHLAQLAAGVERVAGEDQQIGGLARLQAAVCLVESEQGGRPGGQGFESNLAR